jgi:hypothetical protein
MVLPSSGARPYRFTPDPLVEPKQESVRDIGTGPVCAGHDWWDCRRASHAAELRLAKVDYTATGFGAMRRLALATTLPSEKNGNGLRGSVRCSASVSLRARVGDTRCDRPAVREATESSSICRGARRERSASSATAGPAFESRSWAGEADWSGAPAYRVRITQYCRG